MRRTLAHTHKLHVCSVRVCVCVRVRACVHACMHACVRVLVDVCLWMHVSACAALAGSPGLRKGGSPVCPRMILCFGGALCSAGGAHNGHQHAPNKHACK